MSFFCLLHSILNRSSPHHIYNCWHIRNPNGMLYYAIDYIKKDSNQKSVLCRPTDSKYVLSNELQGCDYNLIPLSIPSYLFFSLFLVFTSHFSSFKTFTASCHPFPFLTRNTIILHDHYPFTESSIFSLLKKLVLFFSLFLSDCSLGYINKSDSFEFAYSVKNIGLFTEHHMIYLPNISPAFDLTLFSSNSDYYPLKIGLCGTASSKKNYIELVTSFVNHNIPIDKIIFVVYGFETPYIRSVIKDSPYKFVIFDSTLNSFETFASNINLLACVSFGEGFCRPVSALLKSQIPVLLLDTPTLIEFYSSTNSLFFSTIDEVSQNIYSRIQILTN